MIRRDSETNEEVFALLTKYYLGVSLVLIHLGTKPLYFYLHCKRLVKETQI